MAGRLRALNVSVAAAAGAAGVYFTLLVLVAASPPDVPCIGSRGLTTAVALVGLPLAGLVGIGLFRAGQQRVGDLAFRDDLTGLLNRRAFVVTTERGLRRAGLGNVGMILYDVDSLKSVNDGCGHQAGDELLRLAARQLQRAAGQDGNVFRIGGDEFAVVVDRGRGGHVADVVRSIRPFASTFSTCTHEHTVRLTSGYTSSREGESFDSIFRRADEVLRQNKERMYAAQGQQRLAAAGRRASAVERDDAAGPDTARAMRVLP